MPEPHIAQIALGLGSNTGDRLAYLQAAIEALAPYVIVTAKSQVYEVAPAYVSDQPAFLNAVVVGTTKLEPLALLWLLKDIESEIGRTPTYHYGPRIIDIDMLFYDDAIIATPELTLPHPRLGEREFVLRPLSEVAPTWRHPQNNQTAAEMLAVLPDSGMKCLGAVL